MAARFTVALAVACVVLAGIATAPTAAQATRARSARRVDGRAKARLRALRSKAGGMPRFLGEGAFSHAFQTRDGKHVIKRLKPVLLTTPLTGEERAAMAGRTVESIRILRRAGLPVTSGRVPDRHPQMVVQRFARRGVAFRELGIAAKLRALAGAVALSARAWWHLRRAGARGVFVDPLVQNMRFDRSGRVVEWFDPVAPVSVARWFEVVGRSLVSRDRPARRRAR